MTEDGRKKNTILTIKDCVDIATENQNLKKQVKKLTEALAVANEELDVADECIKELECDIKALENQLHECQEIANESIGSDYEKQVISDYNRGRI